MPEKTTGFASPAMGYEESRIDLNSLYINNPAATFFLRMESDEMAALGLPRGSLLIVDRSVEPSPNRLVWIQHEGQFLCRLMVKKNGKTIFTNGKEDIKPISGETEICGTVTAYVVSNDLPY